MTWPWPPYQHSPGIGTLPAPLFSTDARDRRGLGTIHASPVPRAAPTTGPPPPPRSSPYGGLFSGSLWDQANKLADYTLGPYQSQYQQMTSQHATLDTQRLNELKAYIAQIASAFTGVAPEVLAAYRGAAQDQTAFAQGFSDAVKGAVQGSADQDNRLLAEIGAPSGQNIPGSQATGVGDVVYGLGGWIPATSLAAQGARAFANAAELPAIIQQRGLGAVADLLGKQEDAQAALDAAYQQTLAGRPGQVLDYFGQLQQRQAGNQAARAKAVSDATAAAQRQADTLTTATGYLYVVTKNGQIKRATDRAGKPIQTLAAQKASQTSHPRPLVVGSSTAGWTIYDPASGKVIGEKPPATTRPNLYPVVDKQTGDLTWYDRSTGQPVSQSLGAVTPPQPKAQAPHFYSAGDGEHVAYQDPKTGKWKDQVIAPPSASVTTHYDPATGLTTAVDPRTGKVLWRQQTGTATPPKSPPTPKPPDTFSSNGQAYAWQQNKYGNWVAVPVGGPRAAKAKFTPLEISRFKATAADSAYDAFWGVKDKDGNLVSPPKHYQEAMNDLLAHGIPLDIAQQALNRYWSRPGYDADIANREKGKRIWFHSATGRPVRPFQARQGPKGGAAAEPAAAGPVQPGYPLGALGDIIGFPHEGSHTLYGNWESDNAIDIAAPVGTPVYAVVGGTIGSQIGALNSSDPHLLGLRVHLVGKKNEFYYAHLSRLVVKAGQHVHTGQLIGYSGAANGVAHLHFAEKTGDPSKRFTKSESGPAEAPYSPQAAMTPKGARNTARDMAKSRYGWMGKEWGALNNLWTRESNFNYKATNPTSGAAGIPQALGHELPPEYAANPVVQIVWGLEYIKSTYGTPSRAWAFWRATVNRNASLAPKDLRGKAAAWIQNGYEGY